MRMSTAIARTDLYSYLVTRHTGRTVRTSIEQRLAEFDGSVLAVLDLRHVPIIDFSCADEVVAKLVMRCPGASEPRRFFLFRGIADHHLEPIECALSRQELVAAGERLNGDPILIGSIERDAAQAWRELWMLGLAGPDSVARRLAMPEETAAELLLGLCTRGLVIRRGHRYQSFGQALAEAGEEAGEGDPRA